MIKRKLITIFILFAIGIIPISSSFNVSSTYLNTSSSANSGLPESHLIEGVPYVSQETNFYCAYASATMVIRYYGINATLHEVLYNSGVGYSFAINGRNLINGYHLSFRPADRRFLASLYGLSYEKWKADTKAMSDDECWQEYWGRVKQNISEGIPVVSAANPFLLPTTKETSPDWVTKFNLRLPSSHAIVLVGYNEGNRTVCFNDPQTALFGAPEKGLYVWMDLTNFTTAVRTATLAQYQIEVFTNTSADPLNKTEIFNRAHQRNIERMTGNKSAYDESCQSYSLGINGLKELRKDLDTIGRRLPIIFSYKLRGGLYRVFCRFIKIPELWKSFFLSLYDRLSTEKHNMSQYLNNNSDLSEVCEREARLFEQGAENWSKLDSYLLDFENIRLINVLLPRITIHKMIKTLDNIIAIEEAIIVGPVE